MGKNKICPGLTGAALAMPTAAQREKLAPWLADDNANPADAEPWKSVNAAALARVAIWKPHG